MTVSSATPGAATADYGALSDQQLQQRFKEVLARAREQAAAMGVQMPSLTDAQIASLPRAQLEQLLQAMEQSTGGRETTKSTGSRWWE